MWAKWWAAEKKDIAPKTAAVFFSTSKQRAQDQTTTVTSVTWGNSLESFTQLLTLQPGSNSPAIKETFWLINQLGNKPSVQVANKLWWHSHNFLITGITVETLMYPSDYFNSWFIVAFVTNIPLNKTHHSSTIRSPQHLQTTLCVPAHSLQLIFIFSKTVCNMHNGPV